MTISTLELQSEAEGGWRLGLGGEWVPSDGASAQFPTDRALSNCGAIPPQPPARGPSPFRTQQHQQPVYSMTVALAAAWQEAAPMMPCRTDSPRGPCLTVGLTARCWRACCLPSLGLWAVLARLAL